jgi:serine/threonine-protein kinase
VPQVLGLKYPAAAKALKQAGFRAVRVDSYSDDVAEGLVASVEPGEGQTIPEGSEVDVYVSIGPEFAKLTMPDVRNLPLEDATARLEGKGLRIDVVQSCGGNGAMVVDTDPVAGVTVRENDVVALFVC